VVLSNLAIAVVHGATLVLIARATRPVGSNARTPTPRPMRAARVETAR